jgi:hypothetical protein
MKPTINLHNVTELSLSPPVDCQRSSDGSIFWHRTLTVRDKDGEKFSIGIYGDLPQHITLEQEMKGA